MSLQSGRKFTGFKWTQLPIPPEVITRVNHLGKDQPKDLTFFDRSGQPIDDDDTVSIAGVDGAEERDPEEDDQDDRDIAEELEEIAAQDNVLGEIREVDGEAVELQAVHQVEDPTTGNIVVPETTPTPQMVAPVNTTGVRRSTRTKTKPLNYALSMIQSLTDAATKRIENGNSAEIEIAKTTAFCIAGLRTLIE